MDGNGDKAMRNKGIWAVIAALGFFGAWGLRQAMRPPAEHTGHAARRVLYQCSMHPEIVRDQPGDCPICHMKLLPVEAGEESERKILFYRHPMRPDVTSSVPAKDEMGMDYVPVYDEGGPLRLRRTGEVPGRAAFKVSPERRQLIGVTFAEAAVRELEVVIRASARVAFDPDLYAAIEEYRQVSRGGEGARELAKSARMKLRLLGLSEEQIIELASRTPEQAAELVLGRKGGKAWVYADVYSYEVDLVKPGQTMELTSSALPGQTLRAKVAAVDPVVNPMTRTVKVRAEVDNPEGRLRPETYLDAKIRVPLGRRLAVPREALLDTGEEKIVFVAHADGTFEPRRVTLGREGEGFVVVLSGVSAGDQVVTSANFLIDSESRVQAALKAFLRPPEHRH